MISHVTCKRTYHQKVISIVLLCLIVALGAALRIYNLGTESYWYDEVIMVHVAQQELEDILTHWFGGRPPLYVLLAHFWTQFFGTSEVATRSLSVVLGVASIPVLYMVGQALFGRRVGLISALLMTVSEFHIWFSQEFKYYALFGLMTLVSFLFYIWALKRRKVRDFGLYVIASILLFYAHHFGVFILIAEGLYFVLQWPRYRGVRVAWLWCQAAILLCITPSIIPPLLLAWEGANGPMHPGLDPALWWPLKTVLRYLLAGQYNLGLVGMGIILAAGVTFLGIGTFVFAVYQGKDQWLVAVQRQTSVVIHHLASKRRELLLVVCWLLCPVILLFIVSKVCGPIYNAKYISSAAPALYLVIAFGLASIRRTVPEWVWIGVIVILVGPGLQQYYVTDVKSQWRDMAVYIEEHATKDDIVVLVSNRLERVKDLPQSSLRLTFSWYSKVELPICEVDLRFTPDQTSILDALRQCLIGHESFWLILWDVDDDPQEYIEQMVLKPNRGMIDLESRGTFTDISLYSSHGHDIVSHLLKKQSVIPSRPD